MNPATRPDRTVRQSRRRPRTILTAIVLVAVFAPLGYVFTQFWTATRDAVTFVEAERAGVAYARPVTTLLAALVDAQTAAVSGTQVDTARVRAAVEDVNRADRGSSHDPLQIRQRWAQLTSQIEAALVQKATGQEAMRAYAVPIGLAQALMSKIGDAAKVIRDPAVDGYHLADAAMLRIPEVIVNAGQLATQARTADAKTNRVPASAMVARDRVTTASNTVSVGLRSGADSVSSATVDINLLKPLDEFSAAVGAIVQAASAPDLSTGTVQAGIDTAQRAVQETALKLSTAVLNSFDSMLADRADDLAAKRRNASLAGVLAAVAGLVLLWLRLPVQSATRDARAHQDAHAWAPSTSDEYPPEVVHVGRAVRAGQRRHDDSR